MYVLGNPHTYRNGSTSTAINCGVLTVGWVQGLPGKFFYTFLADGMFPDRIDYFETREAAFEAFKIEAHDRAEHAKAKRS